MKKPKSTEPMSSPREYAAKAIREYQGPLVQDEDGTIEELQCVIMVLSGMILALTQSDKTTST